MSNPSGGGSRQEWAELQQETTSSHVSYIGFGDRLIRKLLQSVGPATKVHWIINGRQLKIGFGFFTVKWPPNNLITLSRNEQAYPGEERKTQKCKILGHRSSYKQAEQLIEYLEEITDSDDAVQQSRGARCRPPKKLEKIPMNLYSLKPKNKAANNLCITDVQLKLNEINPTPNIVIPEGAMGKADRNFHTSNDQADSIAIENSSQAEFCV
ncbi:uncharacterized protein LOC129729133 [Wyeomyia smithii]|uniref:uncharacterized protein LOC129729133 n=1 Tax=Wyeomyia smithii TaxID=174621 RepID=UPI002467EFD2|nr:uncharacterized protein LOC129729133 [Wyeomyia smithii]